MIIMYELEKGDRLYTQVVGDTGAKLFIISDLETGNVFRAHILYKSLI